MSARRPILKEDTARVLAFLRTYRSAQHGRSPSLREVAAGCYLSLSQVSHHLEILAAYGLIVREPSIARGIWLTDRADRYGDDTD